MRSSGTSLFVLMSVGLGACGGGGSAGGVAGGGQTSGGYSGSVNVDFTQIANPSSFETAEYFRSGALDQINASSIYSVGGTGEGQLVAVIDTGIDTDHPQLINNLHPESTYIVTGNKADVEDGGYHGTMVAGVIAAERDNSGLHGVAFDAQILAIRADSPGTCPANCSFSQTNLAAATDYAVTHNADVINYSLGGANSLTSTFRQSLNNAADAGAVLVLAAGNDGASESTFPGQFAAQSGSDGRAIVVGAVDSNNNIAGFSNRAGVAKNAYIVAPGMAIESTFPGGGNGIASGTSMAAPVVSGAAAALMDAAPSLTPEQVVQLLLTTATDLGAPGVDDVYGWGLLNLEEAISPQGTLSIPTSDTVDGGSAVASSTSLALGGALGGVQIPAAEVMLLDGYQRAYMTPLDAFALTGSAQLDLTGFLARRDDQVGSMMFAGGQMGFTAYDIDGADRQIRLDREFGDGLAMHAFIDDRGRLGEVDRSFGLDLINETSSGHAFSGFAKGAGFGVNQRLVGRQTLSLTAAGGAREGEESATRLLAAGYAMPITDGFTFGMRAGQLEEDEAVLGSRGQGAFALQGWQATSFAEFSLNAAVSERFSLFMRAAIGRSRGQEGGDDQPLALDDFWSTSWALGWQSKDLLAKADRLTVAIAQPLRAENAGLTTNLPVARSLEGEVIRDQRHERLNDQGREIDLELAYRRSLDDAQTIGLNVMLRHEPGHDRSAHAEVIGVATYRLNF